MSVQRFCFLIRLSYLKEYRNKYPRWASWLSQSLSEFGLLLIYWYTAKAFVPNLLILNSQTNYFSFIVVGEATLLIPCLLMTTVSRVFRSEVQQGTFEISLLSKTPLIVSWTAQIFGLMAVESLRLALVFIFAFLIFDFHFPSAEALGFALLLQLAAAPFFFGLGLLAASVILVWGRGERLLPMATTGMTVLAGAYFPPDVLPSALKSWLSQVSPMNVLLQSTRSLLQNQSSTVANGDSGILLTSSLVFLIFGLAVFQASLRRYRHRTQPLLFLT